MRSSLVHALVVGCTIVGFSGCSSGGGWHMPGAGMFGWGKTNPDPQEYADSAPLYNPAASKTAGSSGLPAPGASSNSFSSQPASYSGSISDRYPTTGSGSAARSPAGPYGSYAESGRGNARDAYPSRSRYDRSLSPSSSKPYGAYGSSTSSSLSRGFEGKNPYISSTPSGSSSRDSYGPSAAPRYGDREISNNVARERDDNRIADLRGSGSRGTAAYNTAPRRSSGDDTHDHYQGGSSTRDRSTRDGQSGPYVSGANVNRYEMGSNNRIPGNTGYTPPAERGNIVSGDSYSGGSGSRSYENPFPRRGSSRDSSRSSTSVPAEYRPGGTGDYRSTTDATAPSYGAGTPMPIDRESETTSPVFRDSDRYSGDY